MTTLPFLPETDIAWIAPLPLDQKRKALEDFNVRRPIYTYRAFRISSSDLMNLETGMFGALPPPPFERIAEVIKSNSRFPEEAAANLRVAEGLYNARWKGRPQPFGPMATTIGQKLSYWSPAVLAIEDKPVVMFLNPRRDPLPPLGRRFAFSMMHEQIRIPDPDYAAVTFGICHFKPTKVGVRPVKVVYDTGVELYSFDELQSMLTETYAVWEEIYWGRVGAARRGGGGGSTPFGF